MQKTIVALTISAFLVGCGSEKTEQEVLFEQKKEMLLIEQSHQRELARIEARKIEAANPASHTYVENETEYNGGYNNAIQDDYYSEAAPDYDRNIERSEQASTTPTSTATQDSGFSGGEMLLAGAAGLAGGYLMGEMLSNGMKSYQDESGKTHYVDSKTGKAVSQADYEKARKTSKVTKFKEKAKDLGSKAKTKAKSIKDKAKPKLTKIKEKAKYQARKGKVLAKKQAKKIQRKVKKGKR